MTSARSYRPGATGWRCRCSRSGPLPAKPRKPCRSSTPEPRAARRSPSTRKRGNGTRWSLRKAERGSIRMVQMFDLANLRYRVERFYEGITDVTLVVLKGHLLLEEVLIEKVCAKCPSPKFVKKARLSFSQRMTMVRALYTEPTKDQKRQKQTETFWGAVQALNEIRNSLAHHLEPKDISDLLERLGVRQKAKAPISLLDPELGEALGHSIAMLLGFAAALGTVEERQAGQEESE